MDEFVDDAGGIYAKCHLLHPRILTFKVCPDVLVDLSYMSLEVSLAHRPRPARVHRLAYDGCDIAFLDVPPEICTGAAEVQVLAHGLSVAISLVPFL